MERRNGNVQKLELVDDTEGKKEVNTGNKSKSSRKGGEQHETTD